MTTDPEFQMVMQRLEKVEKQNRMFRRCGIAVLIAVNALLLMGQAAPKDGEIEEKLITTQKLILTDAAGKQRAFLTVVKGDPALVSYDAKGNAAITIGFDRGLATPELNGPTIYLSSPNGDSYASLRPSEISLNEYPPPGRAVSLNMHSSGAGLALDDGSGTRAHFALLPSGPTLGLYDKSGEKSATLSYTKDGPSLELEDSEGYTAVLGRSALVTPKTGESHQTSGASLVLFDKEKSVIWKAP